MLSNAGAYLPLLTETQKKEVQTACNSAIRAVAGLPKRGHYPITEIRTSLGIRSVDEVCQAILYFEAWKLKPVTDVSTGVLTRGKSRGDIKLPGKKGWSGKMIKTKVMEAWNYLPQEIRNETCQKRVKRLVNEIVRK